jgi:hypothetical protein
MVFQTESFNDQNHSIGPISSSDANKVEATKTLKWAHILRIQRRSLVAEWSSRCHSWMNWYHHCDKPSDQYSFLILFRWDFRARSIARCRKLDESQTDFFITGDRSRMTVCWMLSRCGSRWSDQQESSAHSHVINHGFRPFWSLFFGNIIFCSYSATQAKTSDRKSQKNFRSAKFFCRYWEKWQNWGKGLHWQKLRVFLCVDEIDRVDQRELPCNWTRVAPECEAQTTIQWNEAQHNATKSWKRPSVRQWCQTSILPPWRDSPIVNSPDRRYEEKADDNGSQLGHLPAAARFLKEFTNMVPGNFTLYFFCAV